ncbi:MAG: PCRF domain-containing protein, partial [Bacilli bacterium]|nr:PCRF domain-containing protein [Bacilli bacterium]
MKKYSNSGALFDLAKFDKEIDELTAQSEEENFWNNSSKALEIISRQNYLKNIVGTYRKLASTSADLDELMELGDESFYDSIEADLETLKKESKEFELQILFTGEFDSNNTILEIHPGAGGTEAQDWADMLYRMYVYYCEIHKFKMSIIYMEPAEDAGIKSATLKISGQNAYG